MGFGGQRQAPAALPSAKDPVPMVQETGWTPESVWMGVEHLPLSTGFDPLTVQLVASRCTDYIVLAYQFTSILFRTPYSQLSSMSTKGSRFRLCS
jgi:hypothetical protein